MNFIFKEDMQREKKEIRKKGKRQKKNKVWLALRKFFKNKFLLRVLNLHFLLNNNLKRFKTALMYYLNGEK